MRNKKQIIIVWVGLFLVIALVAIFLIVKSIDNTVYNRFPDRGVPRINIDLNNISLSEIKEWQKGNKYGGNSLQVYDEGNITEYDDVEIKGRGNLSWDQPKKSYQIKFSKKVNFLGPEKVKEWVLISNYLDKSYLRNDIALFLAEVLEVNYNHRGEFVEIYFNGEYEGLYYLINKVEIAKDSVDLRKEGSLLFELDNIHNEGNCYWTSSKNCLVLKDYVANDDRSRKVSVENFLKDFNRLEKAAESGNYDEVVEIAGIDSLVNFYLINEFVVDPDAYSSSFYLYRDGTDGKISLGPVWDFDLAFGNRAWGWGQVEDDFYLPNGSMARKREAFGEDGLEENKSIAKLFYYLMDIDEFKNDVKNRFVEKMSGRYGELIATINKEVDLIERSMKVDAEKWGRDNTETDLNELLDWIRKRYEFFEKEYGEDGNIYIKML